jgi:hypothetical protein
VTSPPLETSAAISNKSTNTGAVAGGVIAALFILLLLAWSLLLRWKRGKAAHEEVTPYPFVLPQIAIRSAEVGKAAEAATEVKAARYDTSGNQHTLPILIPAR